jgi:alkylated DNA repair dioxygenase AlkB
VISSPEAQRVGKELEEQGHALTSFDRLGLSHHNTIALELRRDIEATDWFRAAREKGSTGTLMFRDQHSLSIARRLMSPVVAMLFRSAVASEDFVVTTINRYEAGDKFPPHQDYFDGTVLIATTAGERRLHVYEKDEDDVFVTIEKSYTLTRGSIALLNGYQDRGHAAECVKGPSISVIANVPHAI